MRIGIFASRPRKNKRIGRQIHVGFGTLPTCEDERTASSPVSTTQAGRSGRATRRHRSGLIRARTRKSRGQTGRMSSALRFGQLNLCALAQLRKAVAWRGGGGVDPLRADGPSAATPTRHRFPLVPRSTVDRDLPPVVFFCALADRRFPPGLNEERIRRMSLACRRF